jgi:hypothetical protein
MSRSTLSGRGTVINDGSPKVVGKGRKRKLLRIMATIRQRAPILAGRGTVTASLADLVAPTVPTGVSVAVISSSALTVSWAASSDTSGTVQSGVAGYRVYRSTSSGGTYSLISGASLVTGTSYPDTGLSASTAYWYKVSAVDAAGNASAQSSAATGTTLTSFGWTVADGLERSSFEHGRASLWFDAMGRPGMAADLKGVGGGAEGVCGFYSESGV